MRFKGILLDLDGTLYDYDKAHAPALAAVVVHIAAVSGKPEAAVGAAIQAARQEVHQRLAGTAASHNRLLYFQGACERLGTCAFPLAHEAYGIYWDVFMKNMAVFDGVAAFFRKFSGTPIVLVTDLTADIQHRKVAALGLSAAISFLVTSEEAGREKPAAPVFRLALDKLGLLPGEACMIGDDPGKDVAGAAALGIFPVWFNPSGTVPSACVDADHYQAASFQDIQEFLAHE